MKKLFLTLPIIFTLIGCSTTIPVNYVPSPSIRGTGDVEVGKFVYAPYERNEVKANQFQSATAAIGATYLSENVSDLIEQSLNKELLAAGFSTEPTTKLKISGTVDKLLFDWIGFVEMDMYLDVTYTISKNGNPLVTKKVSSHKALPKMPGYDSEAIRSTIADNISKLLLDLRKDKLL